MNTFKKGLLAGLMITLAGVILTGLGGCSQPEPEETDPYTVKITIPGTASCQTPLNALADGFNDANPGYQVIIPEGIGSDEGIRAVRENEAIMCRVDRTVKDSEAEYKLTYLEFAKEIDTGDDTKVPTYGFVYKRKTMNEENEKFLTFVFSPLGKAILCNYDLSPITR